jgi:ABC-type sugar transport system ATPase subunit
MVREPLVFLFDEPLSNLDAGLRAQMRIEIGALQRRLETTTVYVTHDQVEAMTLGDRIVVLANGVIQQVGPPIELYRAPANRFVAGFIGSPPMNFIEGALTEDNGVTVFRSAGVSVPLPHARVANAGVGPVTLGVRPEDLTLDPAATHHTADASLQGVVVLVERLGGTSHVHFESEKRRFLALLSGDALPEVGESVGVHVRGDRVHLFGADGRAIPAGPG